MDEAITIETDLFEHRNVQPYFINPCCFGEDFAAWLKAELSDLEFCFSEIIQEDYGWAFGLRAAKIAFGSLFPMSEMDRRSRPPSGLSQSLTIPGLT
jgi:hypothetical protein